MLSAAGTKPVIVTYFLLESSVNPVNEGALESSITETPHPFGKLQTANKSLTLRVNEGLDPL